MIWFSELLSVVTGPLSTLDSPTAHKLVREVEISSYIQQCIPARATLIGTTIDGHRSIGEWNAVFLYGETEITLPVAAAGEGGHLRIYHSMWPILGRHEVRAAILLADPSTKLAGNVNAYFKALDDGDVEDILRTFAPKGYFREPSGEPFVHRGLDELRQMYSAFFSEGGVSLEHATVTTEDNRTALEYNCNKWGTVPLPSQAGLAIYRDSGDGLLAVHVYDDVAAPE